MKILIQKENLEHALQLVSRIVHTQTHQALQGVRIFSKPHILLFQGTNIEMSVEVRVPGEVDEEVDVLIPVKTFLEIVKLLPKGEIQINIKETTCEIITKKGKTTLTLLQKEEFPALPKARSEEKFSIETKQLTSGLQSVLYAVSHSTIKPELASVSIYQEGVSLIFAGTDSFRLAEKKIPYMGENEFPSILLPVKNAQEILSFVQNCTDERVELILDEDLLECKTTQYSLTSRLTSGTFPDYKKILPKTYTTESIVLKEDLIISLKKAGVMSDTTKHIRLRVSTEDKKVTITSKNGVMGDTHEELTGTIEGESVELSFNERFIQDCFQSIPVDTIKLGFSGVGKPLVIQGVSDGSFLYLVMPMNK
jgi:DNA polymerase-3 subunit beta